MSVSFVIGVILTQSPCHAFVVLCVIIGGTSIDALLNCARSRLERDRNLRVPYGNIHECSRTMYIQCKSGQDRRCIDRLANASLMSYCAPLKDLPYFQWGTFRDNGQVGVTVPPSHGAITVLRHPVDRVWSMVRTIVGFTTFQWMNYPIMCAYGLMLLLTPYLPPTPRFRTVSIPDSAMLQVHAPDKNL